MCSNQRAVGGSCNIYYLDNGLCKVGVLDNPLMYSKTVGSSESLVEVRVLASAKPSSVGTRVKPGITIFIFLENHFGGKFRRI